MYIIQFVNELFAYDFMRNAMIAGTLAAIVSAIVGYFVVLRSQTFAGHALSHIGFAGATGAGLIGLTAATGQLLLMLLAAISMGSLGERAAKRDIAIGTTLAVALGLGVLFLYFYTDYAGRAMSILFGDLLGISTALIKSMFIYSVISLVGLLLISKQLLFATLEPELAEAKGMSLRVISIVFLMLVAIAITEASQVVGILLVFTLLIGPAASAFCCTKRVWSGISLSILIGVISVWVGIILAYITNWPISFWISILSFIGYLCFRKLGSAIST